MKKHARNYTGMLKVQSSFNLIQNKIPVLLLVHVSMKSVAYSWLSMRFISSVMLRDPGTSSSEVLGSASISEFSSSDTALRSFLLQQAMAPWKTQRPFASTENLIYLMIKHNYGNLEHAEVCQILSKRPHFQSWACTHQKPERRSARHVCLKLIYS